MEGAETALNQEVKTIKFEPSVPAYCRVQGEIITQDSRHPVKVLKIVGITSPIPFQLHEPLKLSSHHNLIKPPLLFAILGQNLITTYSVFIYCREARRVLY
jgi:hypothetical protein